MKLPKELREKINLKGAGSKKKQCSVRGCFEIAVRSLSENKFGRYAERAKLKLDENRLHKILLCKGHYNSVNKERKASEKLTQKKGFLDDARSMKKGKYFD